MNCLPYQFKFLKKTVHFYQQKYYKGNHALRGQPFQNTAFKK